MTFSPESSPDHKPNFGSFLDTKAEEIGLADDTFHDVMNVIDKAPQLDGAFDLDTYAICQLDGAMSDFSEDEDDEEVMAIFGQCDGEFDLPESPPPSLKSEPSATLGRRVAGAAIPVNTSNTK